MEEMSAMSSLDNYPIKNIFCNNCRKYGHIFNKCKLPIMSYGIVVFRVNPDNMKTEYLMICRKHTLGFIDFMRGKYSLSNKFYVMNMLKQMTNKEIQSIKTKSFDELWEEMWTNVVPEPTDQMAEEPKPKETAFLSQRSFLDVCCKNKPANNNQYKTEENLSKTKFNLLVRGINIKNEQYTLYTMIDEVMQLGVSWEDPEWGFPKGRRNYQEGDYECAVREFSEETGYSAKYLQLINNIFPFEEIFMGSNYKIYKHKYFFMNMSYKDSLTGKLGQELNSEVSKMEWKTFPEVLKLIRNYNVEKRRMICSINSVLENYSIH
jgi:8-oxo-dGTP pyrophosphatase MutT (NUDIX family)